MRVNGVGRHPRAEWWCVDTPRAPAAANVSILFEWVIACKADAKQRTTEQKEPDLNRNNKRQKDGKDVPIPPRLPLSHRAFDRVVGDDGQGDRSDYGHGSQPALLETNSPPKEHKGRPVKKVERVRKLSNVDGDRGAEATVEERGAQTTSPALEGDCTHGHEGARSENRDHCPRQREGGTQLDGIQRKRQDQ